jgi:hypothetical protein
MRKAAHKPLQSGYEKVPLSELRHGRRGKHRSLVDAIVNDLDSLADGEAIKIPLDGVEGISLANLRAAVSRATKSQGVKIATFSDGDSLFVWKKTPGTSQYERKRVSRRA